jgi:transcriptional regulator with XRE-family HTH domain
MKNQENASDIGQRLKEIRKKIRVQQKEMAATLQIAASYLCEIESGNAKPGPDFFVKVASEYNVNLNYLLAGAGDMFNTGQNIKAREFQIDNGVRTTEELLWLMENSNYFYGTILSLANKTLLSEGEIIKKSLISKRAT